MNRKFYHPSADKLFNVIRRANPIEATADVRGVLDTVQVACDV